MIFRFKILNRSEKGDIISLEVLFQHVVIIMFKDRLLNLHVKLYVVVY